MPRGKKTILSMLAIDLQGDLDGITFLKCKHKRPVFFPCAPPTSPPTPWQTYHRKRFTLNAKMWNDLSSQQRQNWLTAARQANLRITGYNLFCHWRLTGDPEPTRTVEHQTGLSLLFPIT